MAVAPTAGSGQRPERHRRGMILRNDACHVAARVVVVAAELDGRVVVVLGHLLGAELVRAGVEVDGATDRVEVEVVRVTLVHEPVAGVAERVGGRLAVGDGRVGVPRLRRVGKARQAHEAGECVGGSREVVTAEGMAERGAGAGAARVGGPVVREDVAVVVGQEDADRVHTVDASRVPSADRADHAALVVREADLPGGATRRSIGRLGGRLRGLVNRVGAGGPARGVQGRARGVILAPVDEGEHLFEIREGVLARRAAAVGRVTGGDAIGFEDRRRRGADRHGRDVVGAIVGRRGGAVGAVAVEALAGSYDRHAVEPHQELRGVRLALHRVGGSAIELARHRRDELAATDHGVFAGTRTAAEIGDLRAETSGDNCVLGYVFQGIRAAKKQLGRCRAGT